MINTNLSTKFAYNLTFKVLVLPHKANDSCGKNNSKENGLIIKSFVNNSLEKNNSRKDSTEKKKSTIKS